MKILKLFALCASILAITACEGGDGSGKFYTRSGPELYGFSIVDSYGVDSDQDFVSPLSIDPNVDGGWFEIYWDVESHNDYTVEIALNDRADMRGAIVVGREYCGPRLACDDLGGHFCHYTKDNYLGCAWLDNEVHHNQKDVYDFLYEFPQPLYLNIRVCDLQGRFCEIGSLPVEVY